MKDMGMTDKQFNLFLRMIQRSLEEAKKAETKEESDKKIDILLEDIQSSIED